MFEIRMQNLLRIIIASGGTPALPVRADWPVHKALVWIGTQSARNGSGLDDLISTFPDPTVGIAVVGATEGLRALVDQGYLALHGNGYTAQWRVDETAAAAARRDLMREDLVTARLLIQAGQRLATWASTALKNADKAAGSWGSTVSGPTPTVRQPPVLALL